MDFVKRRVAGYPWTTLRYRLRDLQKRERANKRPKKVQRLDKGTCEQLCNELLVLCGYQVRKWMLHDEMCCRFLGY